MATLDTFRIVHDFFGVNDDNGAAVDVNPFTVRDVSPLGAVTVAYVDGANRGELAITMAADSEIQNICLYHKDTLQYDIDKLTQIKFRVKMNAAALTTGSSFSFGLTGDRNDAIDSIAQSILFRMVGATSTTLVVVETDDGTNETSLKATGQTLVAAYKTFIINFAEGTGDIRFFMDGQPVATATTFDMSSYTGKLQLFMQMQKTATANVNGFVVDYVEVRGRDSSV